MRVLWTHNFNPQVKNSGSFMHTLAQGMRDLGVDLELCYLGNLRSFANVARAYRQLRQAAAAYDLVHAQFGSACAVATSGVQAAPKLLSLRGSDWYRYREKMGFPAAHGLMAAAMTRAVIGKFDAVVAVSHRMADTVSKRYPYLPVTVLPSPIDLGMFQPLPRSVARARLGFADDTEKWVLFTTMSTSNPIKRVPLAQEAVRLANQRMGGVKLRVATGLDHADMPLFVSACDLALCTSVHEGWPNCIKEALACNLPFVATDVSDLARIAAQSPSCRICLPDAEILADNICEVLSGSTEVDLRRHVEGMDVRGTSQRLLDLYEGIVSSWKRGA